MIDASNISKMLRLRSTSATCEFCRNIRNVWLHKTSYAPCSAHLRASSCEPCLLSTWTILLEVLARNHRWAYLTKNPAFGNALVQRQLLSSQFLLHLSFAHSNSGYLSGYIRETLPKNCAFSCFHAVHLCTSRFLSVQRKGHATNEWRYVGLDWDWTICAARNAVVYFSANNGCSH